MNVMGMVGTGIADDNQASSKRSGPREMGGAPAAGELHARRRRPVPTTRACFGPSALRPTIPNTRTMAAWW
jgi:hypothetical protein